MGKKLQIGLALFPAWFLAGCVSPAVDTGSLSAPTARIPNVPSLHADDDSHVRAVSCDSADSPFLQMNELTADALVREVLARNPSLAQMAATWQAASARYAQVTSWDDPMFGVGIGPATIGVNDLDFAYRLEIAQRLPFPGKLRMRGESVIAETAAAENEVNDMRLQLIESAKNAFYDYYLVDRALAVNQENRQLLKEFRENAESRFKGNLSPEQDLRQAEVEIGRQRERELTLKRMRQVAVARINTLMHLPPDHSLPPPPKELKPGEPLPDVKRLREEALNRPDVQALASRLQSEEAALRLALLEYYPDFEVMAMWDKFMGNEREEMAPMVGVRMNLPVQKSRRHAAVAEAQAKLAQRRAELESRTDQVNFQVQESYEQVLESDKAIRLYEETILPAARENVNAARSAYTAGRIPFLSLIEAQRSFVELQDRHYEAIADYFRRRAMLERVSGGVNPQAP